MTINATVPIPAPSASKRRARFTPAPISRLRLQERDLLLLRFLWGHSLASRSQLQELFFTSTPRTNHRLRLLFDNGLVQRHSLALSPLGAWGEEAVYGLRTAALPFLAEHFDTARERLQIRERGQAAPLFARHTLATVAIGLNVRRSVAAEAGATLDEWLGENEARHHYEWRPPGTETWKSEVFKPDSFMRLRFQLPDESQTVAAFIECDLGHTSERGWAGKLAAYSRYFSTALFGRTYGEPGFIVLGVTTGEQRRDHLREVARRQKSLYLRLATFADLERAGALAPIWHTPSHEGAISLAQGGTR